MKPRRWTPALACLAATLAPRAAASKCDYDRLTLPQAVARAEVVFEGRPIARHARVDEDGIPGWDYVFAVDRQWKGAFQPRQLIFSGYGGCCYRGFARGQRTVIFASLGETRRSMAPELTEAEIVKSLGQAKHVAQPEPPPLWSTSAIHDESGWDDWKTSSSLSMRARLHVTEHLPLYATGLGLLVVPLLRRRKT